MQFLVSYIDHRVVVDHIFAFQVSAQQHPKSISDDGLEPSARVA